jgi:hypothetical protein
VFQMNAHCANWFRCFPDATSCGFFEREPGSDDELSGWTSETRAKRPVGEPLSDTS